VVTFPFPKGVLKQIRISNENEVIKRYNEDNNANCDIWASGAAATKIDIGSTSHIID
jgi:hypothetical protein